MSLQVPVRIRSATQDKQQHAAALVLDTTAFKKVVKIVSDLWRVMESIGMALSSEALRSEWIVAYWFESSRYTPKNIGVLGNWRTHRKKSFATFVETSTGSEWLSHVKPVPKGRPKFES